MSSAETVPEDQDESRVAAAMSALACGKPQIGTDFGDTMISLGKSMDSLTRTLSSVMRRGGGEVQVLAPYLARSLLEVGLTGVIGRLDPFRILALRKVQATPAYDLGKRANSAIQWSGDVHTKDGATARWDPEKKPEMFSRALFDACWNEIAWMAAFERAVASISTDAGDWSAELRAIDPANFMSIVRGRLTANYSALSKGVHNEFVVDRSVVFDEVTVAELTSSTIKYLSWVCFTSHFVDHGSGAMRSEDALQELGCVEGASFL